MTIINNIYLIHYLPIQSYKADYLHIFFQQQAGCLTYVKVLKQINKIPIYMVTFYIGLYVYGTFVKRLPLNFYLCATVLYLYIFKLPTQINILFYFTWFYLKTVKYVPIESFVLKMIECL